MHYSYICLIQLWVGEKAPRIKLYILRNGDRIMNNQLDIIYLRFGSLSKQLLTTTINTIVGEKNKINFLDITSSRLNNNISIECYIKPTSSD